MFGVRRRNPLADKTRFSGLSLHHGFLPLGGCRRLQIRQLQCLQDPARVRAASTDPATFRSIVHAKRHQAYRLERLHRPLRREVDPRLLKPAISDRYERASLLVTSNLPFSEWNQIFQGERMTAALLDRLTHHCQIFEMNGESYRFRESMKSKKSRKAE